MDKQNLAYQNEIEDALSKMRDRLTVDSFNYFIRIAKEHFLENHKNDSNLVCVCGYNILETIVRSARVTPFFVPCGSYALNGFVDELLPRDADGLTRSIYGFLKNPSAGVLQNALILVPLVNDNMKKLYMRLKSEGRRVHGIAYPPVKQGCGYTEWIRQMEMLVDVLQAHTKKLITNRSLVKNRERIHKAQAAARTFYERSVSGNTDAISREFLLESYYYADDLEEWTKKITNVSEAIKPSNDNGIPRVALVGSPIAFPNTKIFELIENAGLSLVSVIDSVRHILYQEELTFGKYHFPEEMGFLNNDYSPAYVQNLSLLWQVKNVAENGNIHGVIIHVLKGHIEYDFEAERLERYLTSKNIPVFRIETDYNKQDVEQLSIRLDAFSEMLRVYALKKRSAVL